MGTPIIIEFDYVRVMTLSAIMIVGQPLSAQPYEHAETDLAGGATSVERGPQAKILHDLLKDVAGANPSALDDFTARMVETTTPEHLKALADEAITLAEAMFSAGNEPIQIARLAEVAMRIDASTADRVVAVASAPHVSEALGEAMARAAKAAQRTGDLISASRIETAIALAGSADLAAAFKAQIDPAALPHKNQLPARTLEAVASNPASRIHDPRAPISGFASHGAPDREMGPTD